MTESNFAKILKNMKDKMIKNWDFQVIRFITEDNINKECKILEKVKTLLTSYNSPTWLLKSQISYYYMSVFYYLYKCYCVTGEIYWRDIGMDLVREAQSHTSLKEYLYFIQVFVRDKTEEDPKKYNNYNIYINCLSFIQMYVDILYMMI